MLAYDLLPNGVISLTSDANEFYFLRMSDFTVFFTSACVVCAGCFVFGLNVQAESNETPSFVRYQSTVVLGLRSTLTSNSCDQSAPPPQVGATPRSTPQPRCKLKYDNWVRLRLACKSSQLPIFNKSVQWTLASGSSGVAMSDRYGDVMISFSTEKEADRSLILDQDRDLHSKMIYLKFGDVSKSLKLDSQAEDFKLSSDDPSCEVKNKL